MDRKIIALAQKFLGSDGEPVAVEIEVEKTTKHHKTGKLFRAEANISMGRALLRAEAVGEDLYEAIDLLEPKLAREIKKFKERR